MESCKNKKEEEEEEEEKGKGGGERRRSREDRLSCDNCDLQTKEQRSEESTKGFEVDSSGWCRGVVCWSSRVAEMGGY